MRRAAPPLPISPKLLKHFAAATVVLTACVAMFADGESREAIQEQVRMREMRNQLIETEAEKLGTKQLKANLLVQEHKPASPGFSDDGEAIDVTIGEGAVSRIVAPPPGYLPTGTSNPGGQAQLPPIPKLPAIPGASVTVRGMTADELPGSQATTENARKRAGSIRPTTQQQARIRELARERTGSVSAD